MYVATYTTCTERRKNTEIDTFVRRCTYSTSCTFVPSKVLSYFRTSLILRRYCTVCSYVRVQYVKVRTKVSSKIIGTFVLSYFRTKYESTFKIVPSYTLRKYWYESTFVRKYFRTKVRKYFRKYFRTFESILCVRCTRTTLYCTCTFESTFVLS